MHDSNMLAFAAVTGSLSELQCKYQHPLYTIYPTCTVFITLLGNDINVPVQKRNEKQLSSYNGRIYCYENNISFTVDKNVRNHFIHN